MSSALYLSQTVYSSNIVSYHNVQHKDAKNTHQFPIENVPFIDDLPSTSTFTKPCNFKTHETWTAGCVYLSASFSEALRVSQLNVKAKFGQMPPRDFCCWVFVLFLFVVLIHILMSQRCSITLLSFSSPLLLGRKSPTS